MRKSQWYFRRFAPGDNLSDPDFAKALFASDSDSAVARSLVREALQNSLDAKAEDAEKVRIRIAINRGLSAASVPKAAPFFSGIEHHVDATDNGLHDRPTLGESVPFLVLEDFGTRGLQGSPDHWRPIEIGANAFFLFFRALGRSGKADESRGRWGVGKFVFPMSSRAHVFWALTIPADTNVPLLMGRTVLRTHQAEGEQWHPDGHWGERREVDSQLVTPVRDAETIAQFVDAFGVARRREPGLSVVVPWLVDEIDRNTIRDAVLSEYFLPLLRGELVVELSENGEMEIIDGAAVRTYAETAEDRHLKERLALAVSVVDRTGIMLEWPVPLRYDDLTLRRDDLPDGLRETLSASLDEGHAVAVRISVFVGRKDSTAPRQGYLTVHLRRVDRLGGLRPLIIRDGISLPEDKTKMVFDHVSLLVAERCAMASAIGDAETPAHEQMQHELLKDRYKYPKKLVTFVRESAGSLVRALRRGDGEDDPLTLASYFPLEADTGPQLLVPTVRSKGKKAGESLPPLPPPRPRRFRVTRVSGGFTISGIPGSGRLLDELNVQVAYDVRRGDPFSKYRPYDFDLSGTGLETVAEGCGIVADAGNRLAIRPDRPDFSITVSGFDSQRDLIVRVTAAGKES